MVALARSVAQWAPGVLLGHGQGAVVALTYASPAMLEVALQARNVQRDEAHAITEGWARLKAVVLSEPRLGRAQ
eukprot:15452236-Alexandrium_andersonii.AAC.1